MIVYLAGMHSDWHVYAHVDKFAYDLAMEGNAKTATDQLNLPILSGGAAILESYPYIADHKQMQKLVPRFPAFILDSGAFTFMRKKKDEAVNAIDWNDYTARLAQFINHFKIDLFFELDIDQIVGLKEVERLRRKLEQLTGKAAIPVWHRRRGMDYWRSMCREYKYISMSASGANNSSEWVRNKQGRMALKALVDLARADGIKVHGLGYGHSDRLDQIKFTSVDSAKWLHSGALGGQLFSFDGSRIVTTYQPKNRTRTSRAAIAHYNFREWVKFARYAEAYL